MAEAFRRRLSNAVTGIWATDEGWYMKELLRKELTSYGRELEKEAETLRLSDRYKDVAKKLGIKGKLKSLYGKPA